MLGLGRGRGKDGWAVYFEEGKGKEYRCFWLSKKGFGGGKVKAWFSWWKSVRIRGYGMVGM